MNNPANDGAAAAAEPAKRESDARPKAVGGPSAAISVPRRGSREKVADHASNEFVVAVVGHVGSGTSEIAKMLRTSLEDKSRKGGAFDVQYLKARDEISSWASRVGKPVPDAISTIANITRLQDLGDSMRSETNDPAAVAVALIQRIRETRAQRVGAVAEPDKPVEPDGKRRAYVLDSIRHPAEVELLRGVYQHAFMLVGVVCAEEVRISRLTLKYSDGGHDAVQNFMRRDAKDSPPFGQNVRGAFHLADAFINNTEQRMISGESNKEWDVADQLSRLVDIITGDEVHRPTTAEHAMYAAHGAALRSACLSRQVGAALIDSSGGLISTGTNEVPRAGGGVCSEDAALSDEPDERCAFRGGKAGCASTREQARNIEILAQAIRKTSGVSVQDEEALQTTLWDSPVAEAIEFSRAVHAEMDAVLAAGRQGQSVRGCRAYVTVFPCHYCARHLVAAGVDEIRYIEPYPKSRAIHLHADAITESVVGWIPPSTPADSSLKRSSSTRRKVLLAPFTGVAPRLYARAFEKAHELKDKRTGDRVSGDAPGVGTWYLGRVSYTQLETDVAKKE